MEDYEKKFYKEALKKTNSLCIEVIQQCEQFANNNDYNVDWVLDSFQEQFSKIKQTYLEGKLNG